VTAPYDAIDLAADEKAEEEIEGEDATDFGWEEANFELFSAEK